MEQRCSLGSRCEGRLLARYFSNAVSHTFVEWLAQHLQSGASAQSPETRHRVVGKKKSMAGGGGVVSGQPKKPWIRH